MPEEVTLVLGNDGIYTSNGDRVLGVSNYTLKQQAGEMMVMNMDVHLITFRQPQQVIMRTSSESTPVLVRERNISSK